MVPPQLPPSPVGSAGGACRRPLLALLMLIGGAACAVWSSVSPAPPPPPLNAPAAGAGRSGGLCSAGSAEAVLRKLQPLLDEAALAHGTGGGADAQRLRWAARLERILAEHAPGRPAAAPAAPAPPSGAAPGGVVLVRYEQGQAVAVADGLLAGGATAVVQARWGGGMPAAGCEAAVWGPEEAKLHCGRRASAPCTEWADVRAAVSGRISQGGIPRGALSADPARLGRGGCPNNIQVLELVLRLAVAPAPCSVAESCNGNADAAHLDLSTSPPVCRCRCNRNFGGATCNQCADARRSYPGCAAEPYLVGGATREPTQGDTCPQGLVEYRCDLSRYPLALRAAQAEVGPQYMGPIACNLGGLPWRCEAMQQGRTVPVASICTLITGEFVGGHFAILFDSVRHFAPQLPFVVGVDNSALKQRLRDALQGKGVQLEVEQLYKTPGLPFWFHEKPALMRRALARHENTLWMDADCFLVAPPPPMPDPAPGVFTFGTALHDYRAWGAKHIPNLYGFTNTGVVWMGRGSRWADAWITIMRRAELNNARLHLTPPHYLDQGPLDLAFGTTKGAFRLEPHWNLAWWTPDGPVDRRGRPNWWPRPAENRTRVALSPAGDSILLDGSPVVVVHSHFVKEEKQYGALDLPFNSRIAALLAQAAQGSKLRAFYDGAFSRFATHVERPSPSVVRVRKASTDFLSHMPS